jgi:serine phosphatase RsbU (regulator of sigma subunit)
VGDVVGDGFDAAAIMGRLRTALAALAPYCSDPGELLSRLDEYSSSRGFIEFATLCYAELDPVAGALRYACAGHPPPLVVFPDGEASWLDGGRSKPLMGEPDGARPYASAHLESDSFLIMYTDGLVERRGAPLDEGLERLRTAARALNELSLSELGDRLMLEMGAGDAADDVVVLCAHYQRVSPIGLDEALTRRPEELELDDHLVRQVQSPRNDPRRRHA